MNNKRTLPDEDDDDVAFLSEVAAAAEAEALSYSKRYKSTSPAAGASVQAAKPQPQEGAYLAALRADDAPRPWQQQRKNFSSLPSRVKVVAADGGAGGDQLGFGGDGACFKCGKGGHWARDCDSGGAAGGGGGAIGMSLSSEPVKACPCGVGDCVVLTANTEKNRGRRFYKCPVREENGGCGFFQWCDSESGMTNNTTTASYNSSITSSFPNLSCPCGAGSCLILMAKTGNNAGQQFYRCPADQGSSCGFFKWLSDRTTAIASLPSSANNDYSNNFNNTNLRSYGSSTSGSSCFKFGKEGHWAKDCPLTAGVSPVTVRNPSSSSSSGSCYKCGNLGHWARECPNSRGH